MSEKSLSLNAGTFNAIPAEIKEGLVNTKINFRTGTALKPKKKERSLPISLKTMQEITKVITTECLQSMEDFYTWLIEDNETKSKVILFANISTGSGLVSDHEHFAAYVADGINEFLYVYINQDNLDRCLNPTSILPENLSKFLRNTHVGEETVADLMRAKEEEDMKTAVEIGRRANELDVEGVPSSDDEPSEDDPIAYDNVVTDITVWKRYATFLSSLNSVMFAIDNHFSNIGRTRSIDQNLIKKIVLTILEEHSLDANEQ